MSGGARRRDRLRDDRDPAAGVHLRRLPGRDRRACAAVPGRRAGRPPRTPRPAVRRSASACRSSTAPTYLPAKIASLLGAGLPGGSRRDPDLLRRMHRRQRGRRPRAGCRRPRPPGASACWPSRRDVASRSRSTRRCGGDRRAAAAERRATAAVAERHSRAGASAGAIRPSAARPATWCWREARAAACTGATRTGSAARSRASAAWSA